MRVLTWNLFHGRADPPAGRPLLHEFAVALRGATWDVALLQEVPPWWPGSLATACDATAFAVPTSRNALPAVRRAIASRAPDLLKANGGGSNAILVRRPWSVDVHARHRLRVLPERRVVHAVRLRRAGDRWDGTWVANVHGQGGSWLHRPAPTLPERDLRASLGRVEAWAAGSPIVLGGDLNLGRPRTERELRDGWVLHGSSWVDHVLARGATAAEPPAPLARGTLSDHAPLTVRLGR